MRWGRLTGATRPLFQRPEGVPHSCLAKFDRFAVLVLERAALHQTRFRTPGVAPDARGVVLGQKGVVLFPSVDRLIAFLRAYGEDGSLDELLPSLDIRWVRTPLRTQEILLSIQAESSYRMDRIAGMAKLAGGLVFTGTSRHFVRYRDVASPLGYDVHQLLDETADVVLYDQTFRQIYEHDRQIDFRDLILKLTPIRLPPSDVRAPDRLLVTAELGIGAPLLGYLYRWHVKAHAAIAEWPVRSAFDDAPRRLYVFATENVPTRIVRLLQSLPGVHVFDPVGDNFAVELGFRHPIALDSCASLFADPMLSLFRGDGKVELVDPIPAFAPVATLIQSEVALDPPPVLPAGQPEAEPTPISLSLKLAPSPEPWRNVVATAVPTSQQEWLAKLLYVLPPRTMGALRIAISKDWIYLIDPQGIEGIPLGTFYSEVAPRIYVPAGLTLVPAVSPDVLSELIEERGDGHVFFEANRETPLVIPNASFGSLSRRALSRMRAQSVDADPLSNDAQESPLLHYEDLGRFPLFGLPGKHPPDGPKDS